MRFAAPTLTVGIDLVRTSEVHGSLEVFGERFLGRIFTEEEVRYARRSPSLMVERLAARLAAKEAAKKALGFLANGFGFRQIEVTKSESGACELELHGSAAEAAVAHGVSDIALSISHEGEYATAVVVARRREEVR